MDIWKILCLWADHGTSYRCMYDNENYIIHTLSIINKLVSLFQLHSKVLIFGSFSSRTLQGPILSIPVSELVPGPPFSQTPSGSLAGSERDSENQKKRGEPGT